MASKVVMFVVAIFFVSCTDYSKAEDFKAPHPVQSLPEYLSKQKLARVSPSETTGNEGSNRQARILATQGKELVTQVTTANGYLSSMDTDLTTAGTTLNTISTLVNINHAEVTAALDSVQTSVDSANTDIVAELGTISTAITAAITAAATSITDKLDTISSTYSTKLDTIISILGPENP